MCSLAGNKSKLICSRVGVAGLQRWVEKRRARNFASLLLSSNINKLYNWIINCTGPLSRLLNNQLCSTSIWWGEIWISSLKTSKPEGRMIIRWDIWPNDAITTQPILGILRSISLSLLDQMECGEWDRVWKSPILLSIRGKVGKTDSAKKGVCDLTCIVHDFGIAKQRYEHRCC